MTSTALAPSPAGLPATLDDAVARALAASLSDHTRRLYRSQGRMFARWCAAHGVSPLPATPETVARYLTARAEAGAKVGTVHTARAAIAAMHTGRPDNPCHSALVRSTVRGLARLYRQPQRQAAPLTADVLAAIFATATLPRRWGRGMESPAAAKRRGALDKAIAGLLFHAGLRRSEAAALVWGDLEPGHRAGTLLVHVRQSKTNQAGRGGDVRMVKDVEGGPQAAAAVVALRPDPPDPAARVLGIGPEAICRRIAAAARAAGLEGQFSGHSGRVGLAVELTRRDASMHSIMLAGGWRSAAMVARYSAGVRAEAGAVARYL